MYDIYIIIYKHIHANNYESAKAAIILKLVRFARVQKGGNHFDTSAIRKNPQRRQ